MHDRQRIGALGEDLAAQHLTAAGLQVLCRNWQSSGHGIRGELDLIARDGDVLVIVEVKTRSSASAGGAVMAVGWDKRRRLRRLTACYLADHPHRGAVRGDVVTVDRPDGSDAWQIRHLRGVW